MTKTSYPPYNPNPNAYSYLPQGWDTGWKTAKAAAGSGPARVLFSGDSIVAGTQGGAGAIAFAQMPGEVALAALKTQYGTYGDYYPAYLSGSLAAPSDGPWSTYNAAFVGDEALGWHNSLRNNAAIAGTVGTFTSPYACTSLDIYYLDMVPNAPGWSYSIDGGAAVPVTTTAASLSGANTTVKKITVSGLSNATHTVVFSAVAATAYSFALLGIKIYSGTGVGIDYNRHTVSGLRWAAIAGVTTTPYPAHRSELWSNKNPQSDATAPYTAMTFCEALKADLVIAEVLYNDVTQAGALTSISSSTFVNVYNNFFSGFRAQNPNCSFLFVIPHVGQGYYPFSDNSLNATSTNIDAYRLAVRMLADKWSMGIVDLNIKWGPKPVAAGFAVSGSPHLTPAGSVDIGNAIKSLI